MSKRTGRKNSRKTGKKKRPLSRAANRAGNGADRSGFALFGILLLAVLVLAGSAVWNGITGGDALFPGSEEPGVATSQVRVEIRNGWGEKGWADRFRNPFILAGYDVVDITNAEDFGFEVSIVAVLKPEAVTEGRALAGLISSKMVLQYEQDSYADLAFILGKDAPEVLHMLESAGKHK